MPPEVSLKKLCQAGNLGSPGLRGLYGFCESNGILYHNQYGFRPKHSTVDAISKFTADVSSGLENKNSTMAVFLDLSKAFDTIDHRILLEKLQYYGVRGVALEWFRNYLTNRTQYVTCRGTDSGPLDVTCGVPQGSVLGPLLFIIYTNDLPNAISHSNCILFADDTTIYYTSDNLQTMARHIEYDMIHLSDWFCANKLSLNVLKTNFVMFAPKQILGCDAIDSLQINGQTIHRVNSTKFLGVYIDDELDWGLQISHIRKKIASGSYAINSAKRCMSVDNLRTLYYSFVHSHLSYANIIWCSTFQSKLRTLEVAQKRAIRNVCGVSYNEHSSPLFKKLGVPQLKDLHKIQMCRLMYNFTNDILPRSLSDLFITNANVHEHNTR